VINFFLLGESLTALQLLGGVLIASAAALLSILPATGASSAPSATPSPAVTTRV
jgi:drug/metabolite transporter (DMT)-like permease